jgi:hypothetical protein
VQRVKRVDSTYPAIQSCGDNLNRWSISNIEDSGQHRTRSKTKHQPFNQFNPNTHQTPFMLLPPSHTHHLHSHYQQHHPANIANITMYPTTRHANLSHPPPQQSHPPPHLAPQLSLNPSVPCNYLSSIIPLAAQLYINTCPLLPHNKKPHNTNMCGTITAWARLSPQREQDILEMERFALGKFADIVWILGM